MFSLNGMEKDKLEPINPEQKNPIIKRVASEEDLTKQKIIAELNILQEAKFEIKKSLNKKNKYKQVKLNISSGEIPK